MSNRNKASDIEQPLSSQFAQITIASPFRDHPIVTNDERTEQLLETPNRTASYDYFLEGLARTMSIEDPPNLDRVRKLYLNEPNDYDYDASSPFLIYDQVRRIGNRMNKEKYLELDWAREKSIIESFDGNVLADADSPSSSNIDPFHRSAPSHSLITPPSLEPTFTLRDSLRRGKAVTSPIQRIHSPQRESLSTVQSFPVSTRGGQRLRRSFISPLQLGMAFIGSPSTDLFFPSPPSSPNKEDSRSMKRLKLVFN